MATFEKAKAKQVSIAEARDRLTQLLHEVEEGERIEVTRRGRPVAVIVGAKEYDRLTHTKRDFWTAYQEFLAKYGPADRDLGNPWEGIREESSSSGRPGFEW